MGAGKRRVEAGDILAVAVTDLRSGGERRRCRPPGHCPYRFPEGEQLGDQFPAHMPGGSRYHDHRCPPACPLFPEALTVDDESFDVKPLDDDSFWYGRTMPRPTRLPIGIRLAATAKAISRAFDEALVGAGGSLPVWLILISLKTQQVANQRELAAAVGIQEATLTHHLNAMETEGLVTRERDPANRRVHQVRLTNDGEALFLRLAGAARAHDARLRAGLSSEEVGVLEGLLDRLLANVTSGGLG